MNVEKDILLVISDNILIRLKNHFWQLLNEREINYASHSVIHTAEPLLSDSGAFQLDVAIVE